MFPSSVGQFQNLLFRLDLLLQGTVIKYHQQNRCLHPLRETVSRTPLSVRSRDPHRLKVPLHVPLLRLSILQRPCFVVVRTRVVTQSRVSEVGSLSRIWNDVQVWLNRRVPVRTIITMWVEHIQDINGRPEMVTLSQNLVRLKIKEKS